MEQQERWQLGGSEPELYERYRVPRQFRRFAELLLEQVDLRPGQRVLDVACGTGIVARLAAPRVGTSGKVVGLDLNEGMLVVARAHAPESGSSVEWQRGDATSLPLDDASFDVVLCQQGLQFFPDRLAALREMRRVAIPGGVVAISVFAAPSRYNTALSTALAKYAGEQVGKRSRAPFALADANALRALVDGAGFAHFEIRRSAITRRIVPSQEWLLQDTSGMPYAAEVAALSPAVRAAMIREIAAALRDLWDTDSFAVPLESHVVVARN